MNAATIQTYAEMADAPHNAEHDEAIRVVVITGAGRGFCAGDDLRTILRGEADAQPQGRMTEVTWRHLGPPGQTWLTG